MLSLRHIANTRFNKTVIFYETHIMLNLYINEMLRTPTHADPCSKSSLDIECDRVSRICQQNRRIGTNYFRNTDFKSVAVDISRKE